MRDPIVIAHRGANTNLPEQSLASYQQAIDLGADGIECDVRMTKDGQLVCHHDRTIDRTSNGTGSLSDYTLKELLDFTFAGRHTVNGRRDQILPFKDLLALLSDTPRKVKLLVEAKHPSRFGTQVETEIHKSLSDFPSLDPTIMSFSRKAVTRYRRLDSAVPLVWLFEYPLGSPPVGTGIIGPRVDVLRAKPKLIERAHAAGYEVYVWTVNEPAAVRGVAAMGADAIITDDPEMALRELGRQSQ